MELDIFIPSINLAIEFHGKQHFEKKYIFDTPEVQRQRDEQKRLACQDNGITLVVISPSWNNSTESLVHSIRQKRPDLLMDYVDKME